MEALIKVIINEQEQHIVSGRELHQFLEVKERYTQWYKRMIEYGFTENVDFTTVSEKTEIANGGYQEKINHAVTLNMAKQIAMIQRTDKGRQAREYFIAIENAWNDPELVLARSLQFANKKLLAFEEKIKNLENKIEEDKIKVSYYDNILQSKDLVTITSIAKDYGLSGKKLNQILKDNKIQYKQGSIWLLYSKYQNKDYTQSKTVEYTRNDGIIGATMHTCWTQKGRLFLYELLKELGYLPTLEKKNNKL